MRRLPRAWQRMDRKEQAKQLAGKNVIRESIPITCLMAMVSRSNQHNIVSISVMEAAYKADYNELGDKMLKDIKKDR